MASKRATAVTPEAIGNVRCAKPQTGDEYLESLRDGREIYIYGERVADVTSHPAFRNTARMTARLFDALHDPARRDKLLLPTDTDGGKRTLQGAEDGRGIDRGLRRDRRWQMDHLLLDGPLPDYKAAFWGTLGGNAEFYALPKSAGTRSAKSACLS
jgi:4-hydroxyphenylacetate 3-monooxygenase